MVRRKTLASLAAELGVSRTTVSNAYNRPEQLSPALRERILAAAAAHGYPGPDPMARSMRTGHVGTTGVVLTEDLTYAFDDMASVDFLAGMAGLGSALTLIPAGADSPGQDAPRLLGRAVVDGFVVYSVGQRDPYLHAAAARGLPLVVCDQPRDEGFVFVGIDDFAAIAPAADALLAAGHRRIGILCIRLFRGRRDGFVDAAELNDAPFDVQRLRIQGALARFERAGMDAAQVPIVTRFENNAATTRAAAQELLEAHPDLTAVLCTTDTMALGLWDYALETGRRVPEDLAITGFDGIAAARMRGLTTVIQPNREKGRAAGEMLDRLIEGEEPGEPVILETTFLPGRTV